MRHVWLAVLFAIAACAEERSVVTVVVADRVGLPEDALWKAVSLARQILDDAGISTHWPRCPVVSVGPRYYSDCPPEAGRIDVYVRILLKPPASHKNPAAAGLALTGGGRGMLVYVLFNLVSRAAAMSGCPVDRVLGHVMAHEVGHLLGISHTPSGGLMDNDWSVGTIRGMCQGTLPLGWKKHRR